MAVFVSYVREDSRIVAHLVSIIRHNGIDVFLDKDSIHPGTRWKDAIRGAIKSGDYFIAVFSSKHSSRAASYANEELIQAIEMLRTIPRDRPWFIPLKIDDCDVPEIPIGAGETLHDLNWISFADEHYKECLEKLLRSLGVDSPIIEFGEPLALGYGTEFDLVGGTITYEVIEMPGNLLDGTVFYVSDGWCARQPEGFIAAQIVVQAPNAALEAVNQLLGLNKFFAVTNSPNISLSPDAPTELTYQREFRIPKGTRLPAFIGQPEQTLASDLNVHSEYLALGCLYENHFFGKWRGEVKFDTLGMKIPVPMHGVFDIKVQ